MQIIEDLLNLNVTNECLRDIMEEIINETTKKLRSDKITDSSKYIQFLRDAVDRIEDRGEREKAKTELVRQEHKTFPKLINLETKEIERIKKEEKKEKDGK